MKNIKKLVVGFSTFAMLGLAACDTSSLDDAQSANTGNGKLTPSVSPELELDSASVLKDTNFVIDFNNTLSDHLDPDVIGLDPDTRIEIRLETDIGTEEGTEILKEQNIEDLRIGLPIESLFSTSYYKKHANKYANDDLVMRTFITRKDIEAALIKDLKESEAIPEERANELELLFNVTADDLRVFNPTLIVTVSDTEDSSGINTEEKLRISVIDFINNADDTKEEGNEEITAYTSAIYDVITDTHMNEAKAKRSFVFIENIETNDNQLADKAEPSSDPSLEEKLADTNAKSLEKLSENLILKVETPKIRYGSAVIVDEEPTQNYSKGDL